MRHTRSEDDEDERPTGRRACDPLIEGSLGPVEVLLSVRRLVPVNGFLREFWRFLLDSPFVSSAPGQRVQANVAEALA